MREVQQSRTKRNEERERVQRGFQELHQARREDVKMERELKAENALMVRSLRSYDLARAQKARTEIRNRQQLVSVKFQKQREAHQEFLAQDFINMSKCHCLQLRP